MDSQRVTKLLNSLYLVLFVLPLIDADCMDRACFPPSPDLVTEDFGRTVTANSTCGDPPSVVLYRLTEEQVICNSSNPDLAHGVENMYDQNRLVAGSSYVRPVLRTWWQSESGMENVVLTLSLGDTFLFQTTQLVFRSLRPSSLIIEKSEDHGQTWVPLRYYARSCSISFPSIPVLTEDSFLRNRNVVSGCMQRYYYGDSTTFDDSTELQQVIYNPVSELGTRFFQEEVLEFFRFTDLRVNLVQPGSLVSGRDYYAVADWSVTGHCLCYGHAEECTGPNADTCVCEHNTMGKHCDQCEPLFNNRPWAAAFMQHPNECQDCGCNGRATSCTYDEVKGYGVCDNCTENSMGDKCESCFEDFFVNPGQGISGESTFCIACNCTTAGSIPGSMCNETDGQCVCKDNVQGRQCEECRDSFYNLQENNNQGCQMCDCDPRGTDGAPNFCDKTTGQCICKINVEGIRCDRCKAGFFNLSLTDPDGCASCDCNGGGATSRTCDSVTGLCDCKMNIGGRSCDQVDDGFFVPRLDGIRVEAESVVPPVGGSLLERPETAVPKSSGRGLLIIAPSTSITYPTLTVPMTQRYSVVVRYEVAFLLSNNMISLSAPGNTDAYNCSGGQPILEPPSLTFSLQPTVALSAVNVGTVCLAAGVVYQPTFTSGNNLQGDSLALDSFVLLPILADLSVYLESGNQSLSMERCSTDAEVSDGPLRSEGNCSSIEFAIMAELFDGAIACNCNTNGSTNSSECDAIGGQCECLPGVGGRDCDFCAAYHYDMIPDVGCQACNCDADGSQDQSCYLMDGLCDCRPNVIGDKCDRCAAEHYGLQTGAGCSPCECNVTFSLNNQCNDTGQCDCKPGVGGTTCSSCLPGYYNITSAGCKDCLCDPTGSLHGFCSADGQCDCLAAATGLKCDICPSNTYGFGPYSERGCLDCVCSGHSTNCSMAVDWYVYTLVSSWSLFDFEAGPEWTGQTGSGDTVRVNTRPILEVFNPRFILELADNGPEEDLFFVSPEPYRGDFRTAYGQMLQFTLSQTTVDNQTVSPYGDIILHGLYSQEPLVASLGSNPGLDATQYSIKVHENYWKIGNVSGSQPDMVYMLQVLSALDFIKIRAKFTELRGNSVFLHEVMMDLGSDDVEFSSNPPADFVEHCECPPEYDGQFCESCVLGYRWVDPSMGSFSDCVPCDCNNHSLFPCNVISGVCSNCTHDTAGDFCEVCADGYYGNATVGTPADCQPCMCPGPPGLNSFAATCDDQGVCQGCAEGHGGSHCEFCIPGYYGIPTDPQVEVSLCRPCFCNLSPPDCNSTTGHCNNCTGNTDGPACGECRFGYYGNIDNCLDCGCNITGSHGNCSQDGVCECLQNVAGAKCTECMPDTWGFESGLGCTSCDCHPVGTLGGQTQCDLASGQCPCKNLTTGLNCDRCLPGYWNVDQGCIPCDCDINGTDPTTCTEGGCSCDQLTGQCSCAMPTIAGRTCDRCGRVDEAYSEVAEVFVGLFPNCDPCPECFHNWRRVLNEHITALDGVAALLEDVLSNYGNVSLQEVDGKFQIVQDELALVQVALRRGLFQAGNLFALQNHFQQVSDEVVSLNETLSAALTQQASLREALRKMGEFNGSVNLGETPGALDPQLIEDETLQRERALDEIYEQVNASWTNIQGLFASCTAARVQAEGLRDEAGRLMDQVDRSSQQRRETLDELNDAQRLRERDQNEQRIEEIRRINLSFDLDAPTSDVRVAAELAVMAKNTTAETVQAAMMEVEQTREISVEAGLASDNASRVEQMVATAQSNSQSYMMVALSVRSNATSAYTEMLSTLSSLNETAESVVSAISLAESTQRSSVRPFTDMAAIVNQINQSVLQEEEVQNLLRGSTTQLEAAESALNATSMAYQEAEAVQALLNMIEHNLDEDKRIKNDTEAGLRDLTNATSNLRAIVNEVSTKADEEVRNSRVLLDDIAVLLQLSRSNDQCYRDNVMMAEIQTERTQNSLTRLRESEEVMSTVTANHRQLDSDISSKSSEVSQDAEAIKQFADSLHTTEQELINIQQQESLDNLLSEYQAQRIEMDRLLGELNRMETLLDQILANLDGTDGTSLQCNDN